MGAQQIRENVIPQLKIVRSTEREVSTTTKNRQNFEQAILILYNMHTNYNLVQRLKIKIN